MVYERGEMENNVKYIYIRKEKKKEKKCFQLFETF